MEDVAVFVLQVQRCFTYGNVVVSGINFRFTRFYFALITLNAIFTPVKPKTDIMNRIKEAAVIAIGIIVLGLCVKSGLDGFSDRSRKVTVKGLSEREVEADKVTWPILTKELGNDLPSLYKA